MKRVFGVKKGKEPSSSSIQDVSDRIAKRGDILDEKIKKLDAELSRYKERIKKTRPGPAQEAVKARATRVLKQKRIYEGQRDMLYNRTLSLDQVTFAAEGVKVAQQTHVKGHGSRWSFISTLFGIGCRSHEEVGGELYVIRKRSLHRDVINRYLELLLYQYSLDVSFEVCQQEFEGNDENGEDTRH